MKQINFYKTGKYYFAIILFFILNFNLKSYAQTEKTIENGNNEVFYLYEMPVHGIKSADDLKNLLDFFHSKEGIVFVDIQPRTYYCSVITKDFITAENVIDILRKEHTKTDDYKVTKLNQQGVNDFIKKANSNKH